MDKVINIGSRRVRLVNNGLALTLYKREFGTNLIPDIFAMFGGQKYAQRAVDTGEFEIEKLDVQKLFNLTYLFAKIADKDLPPQDEWLEAFDCFPIGDVAMEVIPLAMECITADVNIKKQMAAVGMKSTLMSSKRKTSFWQRHRRV